MIGISPLDKVGLFAPVVSTFGSFIVIYFVAVAASPFPPVALQLTERDPIAKILVFVGVQLKLHPMME